MAIVENKMIFKPAGEGRSEGVSYRASLQIPVEVLTLEEWMGMINRQLHTDNPKSIYTIDSKGQPVRHIPAFIILERSRRFKKTPFENLEWTKSVAQHIISLDGGKVLIEQPNDKRVKEQTFLRQAIAYPLRWKIYPYARRTFSAS